MLGPLGALAGWTRVLVRKTKTQLGLPSVGGRPRAQQGRSSGAGAGAAWAQVMGKGDAVGGGATERRRGGRSEAEEDLEDCEEGAGRWGWGFCFWSLCMYTMGEGYG